MTIKQGNIIKAFKEVLDERHCLCRGLFEYDIKENKGRIFVWASATSKGCLDRPNYYLLIGPRGGMQGFNGKTWRKIRALYKIRQIGGTY